MKKFLTVFAAILILTASLAYAQEMTGNLAGVVTDEENAPLPGVTVEATSPALMGKSTSVTDEMGRFRLVGYLQELMKSNSLFPALPLS